VKVCQVCGWKRATRKGRCAACYQWRRRHGHDRDVAQVMASYERQLDRVEKILA
jgi:predicted ATP-dependent serine protease